MSRETLLQEFQDLQIVPSRGVGYLITPGKFPLLRWEHPTLARELFGDDTLTVRWFDARLREVAEAKDPGRYAAYIECAVPGNRLIRRAETFFCIDPVAAAAAGEVPPVQLPDSPIFGMSDEAWEAHRDLLQQFVQEAVARAVRRDPQVAILAAGIAEWDPDLPPALATPSARHQEYHLQLKRRLLGVEGRYRPLQRPQQSETRAPVLVEGSPGEAGFADDLPRKLRQFCEKWEREAGEPFTAVVARRGIVVFHEAYGERSQQSVTRDTTYPLFSITKSMSGVMLALFLDQGLLDLDRPLGEILPDLPKQGGNVITLRQCMMHVTGLTGHNRWRGLDNSWLDNVVANGLEFVKPAYKYSGVAYDLAGMAMQLVAGKSIPRLFHEHLFEPLGFEGAKITGLGSGGHLRAIDLARLGQLLVNGGSYGEFRFFEEEAFEQLLPKSYEEYFPGLASNADDYGLGIYWTGRPRLRGRQAGSHEDATIMSRRTLGHGAFSGTVFRVDLDNEIVIVVGRFNSGANHGDYVRSLLTIVMDSLPEEETSAARSEECQP